MRTLKSLLFTIAQLFFLIYVVSSGFNFVGIPVTSYINYLMWFVCLIIFYFILPEKVGTFFK
jgi:hypothetical protein